MRGVEGWSRDQFHERMAARHFSGWNTLGPSLAFGPGGSNFLVGGLHLVEFEIGEPLDIDHVIAGFVDGRISSFSFRLMARESRFCVFWMSKTMKKREEAVCPYR